MILVLVALVKICQSFLIVFEVENYCPSVSLWTFHAQVSDA